MRGGVSALSPCVCFPKCHHFSWFNTSASHLHLLPSAPCSGQGNEHRGATTTARGWGLVPAWGLARFVGLPPANMLPAGVPIGLQKLVWAKKDFFKGHQCQRQLRRLSPAPCTWLCCLKVSTRWHPAGGSELSALPETTRTARPDSESPGAPSRGLTHQSAALPVGSSLCACILGSINHPPFESLDRAACVAGRRVSGAAVSPWVCCPTEISCYK